MSENLPLEINTTSEVENSAKATGIDQLSFEEALENLEKLVAKMEEGKMPLADLTAAFEKGRSLALFCRSKLNQLEQKIEILTNDDGEGGSWSDFALPSSATPDGARKNVGE
jgi:exodeoxyribonuclease VII small subunit